MCILCGDQKDTGICEHCNYIAELLANEMVPDTVCVRFEALRDVLHSIPTDNMLFPALEREYLRYRDFVEYYNKKK